ncbi:TPA: glycoside hydrolase family 68 protein [Streptococcus suis]|nr:glycoside hydrolase family 68 protein [Streptococcus suis]
MELVMRKKMRKSKKNWIVVSATAASLFVAGNATIASADTVETTSPTTTSESTVTVESTTEDTSSTKTSDSVVSDTTTESEGSETVTDSSVSTVDNSETQATDADVVSNANEVINATTEKSVNEELNSVAENTVTPSSDTTRADVEVTSNEMATLESSVSTTSAPIPSAASYGLTEEAYAIALEANLDLSTLTEAQKDALNKIKRDVTAETGSQMTYKQFEEIANTLVAQDEQYAIPYFNAAAIKNMAAATTRDAQTGEVADLDVWDSWPVQDIKTGEVVNWNGYQLVVAMMGVPNTNDNHLYLLYNKYADNTFDNWKNAGAIFGYNSTSLIQQWSGSAVVNSDGSIQLYYTHVDTSDNNSNNQQLATATLNLAYDDSDVYLVSVDNDTVLTPEGGDGYYYQSYAQWRETFTGADNIAMRDPHVIEDADGSRYLIFEASTGTQNYQGENQIYNWANYGGDAAYNIKSLFAILENSDMYERAKFANAAIGILKLSGTEKNPTIQEYYTPLVSSPMVSDEIERPNVVKLGDKYYLFAASRLNHGSNNTAWNLANSVVGDNVVMLGYVSDSLTSGYSPLNHSGVVLTASVPADWRTATYSYYAVPVEGSSDTLLVTAYMTNRNEVAGKGNNSTWAPSFLIQILPDNTTRVLAKMTEQGDWIWDESSDTQNTVGTFDTAYLPGENDGYIDWSGVGGYGLKPHMPYYPTTPDIPVTPEPEVPVVPEYPSNPEVPFTPEQPAIPAQPGLATPVQPGTASQNKTTVLPSTGSESGLALTVLGLLSLASVAKISRKRDWN